MSRDLVPVLFLAACSWGTERRAERVPAEPLPLAADTILTPFVEIPEAAWLGGRRWVVVSGDHNAVVIADFAPHTAVPLGGSKHKELLNPFGVFTWGDTIYMAALGAEIFFRPAVQRQLEAEIEAQFEAYAATGLPLDHVNAHKHFHLHPTILGAIPAPAGTRGILPKARDAAGQLYFEVPPLPGADGSGNKDSVAIVRADPGLTRFDTVARLTPPEVAEVSRTSGRRFERLVFSGQDSWGVRHDGTLWIARVHPNRVVFLSAGKQRRGEPLPDPVLEVTREDRELFLRSFPEEVRPAVEDLPFALVKPPFERAFAGPDGSVWLRKSRAALDSTRKYQVVDTTGKLLRVFQTVGRGVLIGVDAEAALMAEQYREGVRLMEVRIPKTSPGQK